MRPDIGLLVLLVLYAVLVGFASFGWVSLIGGIIMGGVSGAILAYAPRQNRMAIQLVGMLALVAVCLGLVVAKIARSGESSDSDRLWLGGRVSGWPVGGARAGRLWLARWVPAVGGRVLVGRMWLAGGIRSAGPIFVRACCSVRPVLGPADARHRNRLVRGRPHNRDQDDQRGHERDDQDPQDDQQESRPSGARSRDDLRSGRRGGAHASPRENAASRSWLE